MTNDVEDPTNPVEEEQKCKKGECRKKSNYSSIGGWYSSFSFHATFSSWSFVALLSAFCVLSTCSFMSVLSFGSSFSVLSAFSFMSVGCYKESFKICYGS
eukprot:1797_1